MKHKARGSNASPSKSGKGGQPTTKGKGKGGASGSGSNAFDLKDLPLSLPDFASPSADHGEWVPRFHAILRREEADGVRYEDLDALQMELEAMLAATVVKKNTLNDEVKIVQNLEKHKGTGKNQGRKSGPPSPASKRSGSSLNTRDGSKRFKGSGPAASSGEKGAKILGLPKLKGESSSVQSFDPLQNEQIRPVAETPKPNLPKNETPNRFWAFVEPYCAPITPDDIKLLEDLIKVHGDLSEYHRIPPLGQHYTQRWAKEDLENERAKGSGNVDKDGDSKSEDLLKKAASGGEKAQATPFGELTQRLVAGLMEENIMTSVDDNMDVAKKAAEGSTDGDKSELIKSLNINNAEALESRVRKELEEQGILDANDDDDEEQDEILDELKRCQTELKAVSSHNLTQLKRLLKAAKEEMVRQELRNKLTKADEEVMDAYQKISAARSKKKDPSKKEREQAWRALKERELILKELESV